MSQGSTVKQYPTGIDTFATWEDDIDNILAIIVNDVQDQVISIETELGTDPAGSLTDVKTRLAVAVNNDGTLKTNTVDTDELVADSVNDAKIDLGTGANQVNHATFGFQKKVITVTAANGTYAFDFTTEGLVDYGSTTYNVSLTPSGTNAIRVWAVVDGAKATTGFTITILEPGTNQPHPFDASSTNVAIDVLTLHSV